MQNSSGNLQLLLAIESSCDETAAAVIDSNQSVLSNVVASQAELHERFGGVVPEIASRAHVRRILPTIDEALRQADVKLDDLSAIAVANHPGLVGSLLVGLTAAKTLAMVLDLPLVTVNHIEGHLYACQMAAGRPVFPAIGLVVSGGHTNLYDCHDSASFELIGSTIDDAAGEAFDKVACLLELGYPGGPVIEQVARSGNSEAYNFPRAFQYDNRLDFSFSGLKTAVRYQVYGTPGGVSREKKAVEEDRPLELSDRERADVAASFQAAVVEILVYKAKQALRQRNRHALCIGGGVAANSLLRERLQEMCEMQGVELHLAPRELCTDNAAMAAIAWEHLAAGKVASLEVDVTPGLVRFSRN